MTLNNNTPCTCAVTLRAFRKRIRDSTTSQGYVQWSEDVPKFQAFVAQKVREAQKQLESLLLVGPDDARIDVVPQLALHQVRDNPCHELAASFISTGRGRQSAAATLIGAPYRPFSPLNKPPSVFHHVVADS